MLTLCCALIVSVFTACNKDKGKGNAQSGDEVGTYYYDYDGDQSREYTLVLAEELRFTFMPDSGANRMGTYTLEDGKLTLTDGEWTQTADYDEENESISLTYDSKQMQFLRKTPYTVTFDTDGGSEIAPVTVIKGRTVAKPADPSRADFVFGGWFADEGYASSFDNLFGVMPITANTTLHALWISDPADIPEYTVSFDLGYEGAEKLADRETTGGKLYNAPVPEREGYTFEGWQISMENTADRLTCAFEAPKANGEGGTVFEADTTLFALWHDDDATLAAAPEVSVTSESITRGTVDGATGYTISITTPDGTKPYDNTGMTTASMSLATLFKEYGIGVYKFEVTATGGAAPVSETAVRYFTYGALDRVAHVRVTANDVLYFSAVDGAEKYTISVDCGNPLHNHSAFDNGTSQRFNFSNCDMQEGGIKFVIKASASGFAASSTTFVFERNLGKATNLEINDDVATWDAVEGAAYYDVTLNGETFSTTATTLSLKTMPAGDYDVAVTPVARGYNSPAASKVSYEKTAPAIPADIRLVNGTLSWTAESGARYEIVYGNRSAEVKEGESSIDLGTLSGLTWTAEEEYTVQLRVTKGGEQALSDEFTFVNDALDPTLLYNDGTLSWKPVKGAVEYRVTVNGTRVATITDGSTSYSFDSLAKKGANVMEVTFVDDENVESAPATLEVYAHSVTFNSEGNRTSTVYKAVGDALNAPAANVKVGHDFAAWYNTPTGPESNGAAYSDPFFAGPTDLVLYAYYEPSDYELVYAGEDLGDLTGATVTFGESFKLDVPETTDGTRVFGGWFSSPYGQGRQLTDAAGNSVTTWNDPTDGVKVYAYWIENALEYTMVNGTYVVSAGSRINATNSITIPAYYNGTAVTQLSANAFNGCSTLTSINVPDTMQYIPVGAFDECTNLQAVNVYDAGAGANARYSSDSGVLYDSGSVDERHGMRPQFIPSTISGTFTVPDGVDVIPREAFKNSSISRVIIPDSVTAIEEEAFANCINLTSVVFVNPELTSGSLSVGSRAFMNCGSLTTITFPARLSSLATDKLGTDDISYGFDDMTSYSNDAFLQYWDGLPSGVDDQYVRLTAVNVTPGGKYYSSIDGIVYNASGTELIYVPAYYDFAGFEIPATVTKIGKSAFVNTGIDITLTVPTNVTFIDEFAFAGNSSLETVIFEGDTLAPEVTIGDYAFYDCYSLSTLTFEEGSNVVSIGNGAFMDSEYLGDDYYGTAVSIPSTVTWIGDEAFAYSDGFDSEYSKKDFTITFAEGGTTLEFGRNVFRGLEIAELTLPGYVKITSSFFDNLIAETINVSTDTIKTIGDGIYFIVNGQPDTLVKYQGEGGEFTVEEGTKHIAAGVFRNNEDVTAVTIPASVTSIGESAFRGSSLESVTFSGTSSETLTIGDYAFNMEGAYGCDLSAITLPDRPIVIGAYAFAENSALETLDLGGTTVIGDYAFYETGYYDDWDYIAYLSVEIPASVTSIGESAFEGGSWSDDPKINNITLADGSKLQTIGARAFAYSLLTSFEVPATVTSIGAGAFANCENLDSLTFAEGSAAAPDLVFGEPVIASTETYEDNRPTGEQYSVLYGTGVTEINFPARLVQIGTGALSEMSYYDWDTYETVPTLSVAFAEGSKLHTINPYAFYSTGAEALALPAGITLVGNSAFYSSTFGSITFANGGGVELTVEDGAFVSASMATLALPDTLAKMSVNALLDGMSKSTADNLTAITVGEVKDGVASGSDAFASYEGALYSAGYKDLIFVPAQMQTLKVHADTETIGAGAAYGHSKLESVTFETKADSLPSLLSIGDEAFFGCSMTTITLPDSVTTLGNNVFGSCDELTHIGLPASLERFSASMLGCENLTSFSIEDGEKFKTDKDIAILTADGKTLLYYLPTAAATEYAVPEGVEEIEDNAFSRALNLEKVNISSTVTRIGANAFSYCSNLSEVSFASGGLDPLVIQSYAFNSTSLTRLDLPARIGSIGDYAFYDVATLANVTFGGSASRLDSIGVSAFSNTSISTVILPDSVRSVADRAFANCTLLESATLNEGLLTLGNEVFAFGDDYSDPAEVATELTTVSLPSTLSSVGSGLFTNSNKLTIVTFAPNSIITTLPSDTFSGCLSLASITIPASMTEISAGLFRGLESLTTVTFEDGSNCAVIGNNAFEGSGLQSITFPSSVMTIGTSAFANTDLSEVTIPRTVTSIGANAFSGCSKLAIARVEALITSLSNYVFQSCPELKSITLPSTLRDVSIACFNNSKNIQSISVAAGNPYLTVDEMSGALYNTDMTEIYLLPAVTEFEIPATLTTDEETLLAVLNNCATLETVTVEEGNAAYADAYGVLYNADGDILLVPAGLTEYTLPANKTALSEEDLELLNAASALKTAEVEEGNTAFNASNGVLYDAEWAPVFVPAGLTDYVIPVEVTKLDTTLFAQSNIVSVSFEEGRTAALEIGANAFSGIATLESATLPANITIGTGAFANDAALTTVTLTAGAGTIGADAFRNSPVVNFDLVEGITYVGNNAFNGTEFTKLTLPSTLTTLETASLAGAAIEEFVINSANFKYEEGMLTNADGTVTYYYSPELSTMTIKANETDPAIFDQLKELPFVSYVEVEEGNTAFQSAYGAVYDMDWNLLFVPPAMTTWTIPKEMTYIGFDDVDTLEEADAQSPFYGSNITTIVAEAGGTETLTIEGYYINDVDDRYGVTAFFGAANLTSVTLPTDRNVIIGDFAFANAYGNDITIDCRNITSIYLGENVVEVGDSAFYYWGEDYYFTTNNEAIYVWFEEGNEPSDYNYYWDYNVNDEIIHYGVASNPDAEPSA